MINKIKCLFGIQHDWNVVCNKDFPNCKCECGICGLKKELQFPKDTKLIMKPIKWQGYFYLTSNNLFKFSESMFASINEHNTGKDNEKN